MIFGNIRQEAAYGFLPEDLKEFFVYAASHELAGVMKREAIPLTGNVSLLI